MEASAVLVSGRLNARDMRHLQTVAWQSLASNNHDREKRRGAVRLTLVHRTDLLRSVSMDVPSKSPPEDVRPAMKLAQNKKLAETLNPKTLKP